MIGSPDLVAFTKDEVDFGEVFEAPPLLPEEFSVPLCPFADNASPWTKTSYAKFTKDFILISEFSEQVGPQPLHTIPEEQKVCGTFDLNYFSLRIMSVDYQASFVGHPPGCSYPKLNFVEDSKVVLGDSKEGAFAYVHHLTLYDLEARGFVRPFCIAYISADERKVMQQFLQMSTEFSKASECLKTGNRKAFAGEIEKKLKDLEYTRMVLHREVELQKEKNGCYSTQAIEKANELANVEKSIFEHKDLLKQITSYPNRKMNDPTFLPYDFENVSDPGCVEEDLSTCESNDKDQSEDPRLQRRLSYTPQLIKAKSAKCFDKRLKTLEELCDSYFFDQTMDQLKQIEKSFRGDLCNIYTRQISETLLRKQRITNFLFEDYNTWGDEEKEKGIYCANKSLLDHLPPMLSVSSGEPLSLEPYTSCVETVPIKMEEQDGTAGLQDADLTESSPCDITQDNSDEGVDAEMNCSFSSGDSIEVLGTERSLRDQATHSPLERTAFLQPHGALVVPRRQPATNRANSEDSIEVLSTSEPIVPEELRASYPCAIYETDGEEEFAEQNTVFPGLDLIQEERLYDRETACCMHKEDGAYEEPQPELVHECWANGVVDREPPSRVSLRVDMGLEASISDSPNVDDAADAMSFMSMSTGSDRTGTSIPYGGPVTVKQKKKCAQSALKFIRQFPFAQQAIFCLLSGRTLVVLGSHEGTVRKLVAALSLYVPGAGMNGEAVKAWLSSPFQLNDLQTWKLIGVHRMASPTGAGLLHSLQRYSRYVSVLDVDERCVRCPPYSGALLQRVCEPGAHMRRGALYFLHLQAQLTQLCHWAFLCAFCPRLRGEAQRGGFLRRLGLSRQDGAVLAFLSHLITHAYLQGRDTACQPSALRFSYVTSFLYRM